MQYYIRDRCTGVIVNAVMSSKPPAEIVEEAWFRDDEYYLDANPPFDVLTKYQYFTERP